MSVLGHIVRPFDRINIELMAEIHDRNCLQLQR